MISTHQEIIKIIEADWNERMAFLSETWERLDDADALYSEFVTDGDGPEDWMFIEDMSEDV
tara:strand:+ start:45 stop:227 length:183 start_codon:yes stop_codon:yes gene_type:complete